MKIVIAPDSYKESLTALEACEAIERGFRQVYPQADIVKVPMADGGEGTVQSLVDATGGRIVTCSVLDPMGQPIEAFYGLLGDGKTAIIEMAAASGLALVPKDLRNPLLTSTYGTGQLIRHALQAGVRHIMLGLGGSATNDGGVGMAQALGYRFVDVNGKEVLPGGGNLGHIESIITDDVDPRLKETTFIAACDVDNPMIGPKGASAVFGPQKGATPAMVEVLDNHLQHLATCIRSDLGMEVSTVPGGGAAGGLGAGVIAFLGAELKRGVDIVIEATNLAHHVQGADLVITGEGRIDGQTIYGKTPIGVAKTAQEQQVKVVAIAGSLGTDYEAVHEHGIDIVFSLVPGVCTLDEALKKAAVNLERTAHNVAAMMQVGQQLR
ncbi:glycerate kinase [Paenibacillus sp. SC116]|uniref:glycerate kinase n=1 Tax=Paenibacillus sp. SC116 TaxID=2968986 RepID=UPI00215A351C|nr:glycerate kinase [Paenibacillus sp. SC116]MCR8846093.1 glycerate kinase [Paenibacillus sp. SC116]